ncbi:MAG: hypothetical protein K9K67_10340 [Bacteriovoracaceae bacterium]|nr:hypothetical protein [Bacteriovoracaceae bacterium]
MKMLILVVTTLAAINLSAEVVKSAVKVKMTVSQEIEVVTVDTEEACALTVDPSWSHEEDTTEIRIFMSNDSYFNTLSDLEKLKDEGFRFAGYAKGDKCEMKDWVLDSTFPKMINPNPMDAFGNEFFFHMTSNRKLAEYALKQGAFKKVKRLYIKGDKNLMEKAKKEASEKISDVLKKFN